MYRCQKCQTVSPPRQQELRRRVLRHDGSILREIRLCTVCHLSTEDRRLPRMESLNRPALNGVSQKPVAGQIKPGEGRSFSRNGRKEK
jgi:hypothetical protein